MEGGGHYITEFHQDSNITKTSYGIRSNAHLNQGITDSVADTLLCLTSSFALSRNLHY